MTKNEEFDQLIELANNFLREEFNNFSLQRRDKINCKSADEWVKRNVKEVKFIYLQSNDTQSIIEWFEKQKISSRRGDDGGWDTKIKLSDREHTVDVKSDEPTNKYIDAGKVQFTQQGLPIPFRADYACGVQEDAVTGRITSLYFIKREKLKSIPLKDIWPQCPERRRGELHWAHKKTDVGKIEATYCAKRKNDQRKLT